MKQYHPNPAASLPEGGTFHGRYRVVRCIKSGGMGAVYEVVHLETRRHRALKVMLPNLVESAALRQRFKLEATVAADIDSDHIVETFDAGIDPETGAPFLVMELLRGEDLATLLRRRGRLPPEETVRILAQMARALDKTHAAGIVHRDLKPDNLFLARRDDDAPRLKILDFGIAKVVARAPQAKRETSSVGTPAYMAPEQVKGTGIGPWTDLYAVGHIAYTLLVGEEYWAESIASDEAIYPFLLRVGQGPDEPAAERALRRRGVVLAPAFEAWFARAAAADPAARFAQASAMIVALAEALGVPPPPAVSSSDIDVKQAPPAGGGFRTVQYSSLAETFVAASPPARGTAAPFASDSRSPSRSHAVLIYAGALAAGVAVALTLMIAARRAPAPATPENGLVATVLPPPPAIVPQPPAPPPPTVDSVAPAPTAPAPPTPPASAKAAAAPSSSAAAAARAPRKSAGAAMASAKPHKRKDSLGF